MKNYPLARYTTLVSYLLLLALFFVWCLQFGPEGLAAQLVLWLLLCSGLLLVAPGLIKASRRSHQWLCFILLIYFIGAVQSLLAQTGALSDINASQQLHSGLRLFLVVVCFIAAMLAARWHSPSKA